MRRRSPRAVAGCRYLFHVAADYRLWVPDPAAMFRANVEGTRESDERGARRRRRAHRLYQQRRRPSASFPAVSADEDTPSRFADMIGPYKQSKFQAEEVGARG